MRISRYVNSLPFEGGVLLHSALYNTAIKLYSETCITEFEHLKSQGSFPMPEENKFLKDLESLHMIVQDDTDEVAVVNYLFRMRKDYLNLFLIVTRQCNFRCPYCYQEHTGHVMQWETYEMAQKMFIDSCISTPILQEGPIINLFGGEPLLELKNIICFMSGLKEKCVENHINFENVTAHITTNGYLLTPEHFDQLIQCGVGSYQITLDGLARTHNKSRYLVGKVGSWDTIVANLVNMKESKHNFRAQIRTNFTSDIVNDFDAFIDFLLKNFGEDDRFAFYFESAKDYGTASSDDDLNFVQDEALPLKQLLKMAVDKGIKGDKLDYKYMAYPFGSMCYTANPYEIAIDYDGTLRKCTLDLDQPRNIVKGNIVEGQAAWTCYEKSDKCKVCSIYPICYGKRCPNEYTSGAGVSECNCRTSYAAYEFSLSATYLL